MYCSRTQSRLHKLADSPSIISGMHADEMPSVSQVMENSAFLHSRGKRSARGQAERRFRALADDRRVVGCGLCGRGVCVHICPEGSVSAYMDKERQSSKERRAYCMELLCVLHVWFVT